MSFPERTQATTTLLSRLGGTVTGVINGVGSGVSGAIAYKALSYAKAQLSLKNLTAMLSRSHAHVDLPQAVQLTANRIEAFFSPNNFKNAVLRILAEYLTQEHSEHPEHVAIETGSSKITLLPETAEHLTKKLQKLQTKYFAQEVYKQAAQIPEDRINSDILAILEQGQIFHTSTGNSSDTVTDVTPLLQTVLFSKFIKDKKETEEQFKPFIDELVKFLQAYVFDPISTPIIVRNAVGNSVNLNPFYASTMHSPSSSEGGEDVSPLRRDIIPTSLILNRSTSPLVRLASAGVGTVLEVEDTGAGVGLFLPTATRPESPALSTFSPITISEEPALEGVLLARAPEKRTLQNWVIDETVQHLISLIQENLIDNKTKRKEILAMVSGQLATFAQELCQTITDYRQDETSFHGLTLEQTLKTKAQETAGTFFQKLTSCKDEKTFFDAFAKALVKTFAFKSHARQDLLKNLDQSATFKAALKNFFIRFASLFVGFYDVMANLIISQTAIFYLKRNGKEIVQTLLQKLEDPQVQLLLKQRVINLINSSLLPALRAADLKDVLSTQEYLPTAHNLRALSETVLEILHQNDLNYENPNPSLIDHVCKARTLISETLTGSSQDATIDAAIKKGALIELPHSLLKALPLMLDTTFIREILTDLGEVVKISLSDEEFEDLDADRVDTDLAVALEQTADAIMNLVDPVFGNLVLEEYNAILLEAQPFVDRTGEKVLDLNAELRKTMLPRLQDKYLKKGVELMLKPEIIGPLARHLMTAILPAEMQK